MASKVTKITEALSWQGLKDAFYIGNLSISKDGKSFETFIDKLTEAVEDGTLDKLVVECAEEYHDGNTYEVFKALSKNLSSQLCNMAKKSFIPHRDIEEKRYTILHGYVQGKMKAHKATATGNAKSYWQWSMEEIEALDPATDARTIKSIYDTMMSVKSKYPENAAKDTTFAARLEKISKMHSQAKKLAKSPVPVVDASLIEKLSKGAAKLTAEESAKLSEILKSLGK